jgi:uncharacterized protein (DUF4415 family)
MTRLTRKIREELRRVAAMPDNQIDFSDIPERTDWSGGVVGKFYRPVKRPLTIRLDADVLAWLRKPGRGYQTRINRILRDAMLNGIRRRKAS